MTDASRQLSISVGVRVRPFTAEEENKLVSRQKAAFFADGQLRHNQEQQELELMRRRPNFIRKIVNVVDEKMLIFDPQETNPYTQVQRRSFPHMNKNSRIKECRFVFDHLFDETASQTQVFEGTTKPLLDSVLQGYNATVFAYGATGCGKTHTILGTVAEPGIIFLTMQELYQKIEGLSDERVFDVLISFLEIYNETIRDLLRPETSHKLLNLREDLQARIVVLNLLVHKPRDVAQVMEMIVMGNRNRTCSATEANATLSRSHAVLQINVSSTSRLASLVQEHSFATLSIIDLAGSERAAATKNRGERLAEGANINKSLLALGNCINALCAGTGPLARRRPHVPYRDLKLTRLLKFSLGGNCKTVMIVCVSPLSKHYDETLNTLKYADRAKEIKTKVMRNQHNLDRHVGLYLKMITEQKQEICELRAREARASSLAREQAMLETEACLAAISDDILALRRTVERHSDVVWEKVVLLGKRKLFLMRLDELRIVQESLLLLRSRAGFSEMVAKSATLSSVSRLVEQARLRMQHDIVALEHAYEAAHELDDIFARCTGFSAKRLAEFPAWNLHLAFLHAALVASVHDSIEKEILVNSSVLFDFLLGELDEYKLCAACVQDAFDARELAHVTEVLNRMLLPQYASDVDAAAAVYADTKRGIAEDIERQLDSAEALEKPDKRSSTLPLAHMPPKRRVPLHERYSESFDDSIALKSDFEDDTSAFDHVNHSVLDAGELGFSPGLQSPPAVQRPAFGVAELNDVLSAGHKVHAGHKVRYVSASSAGHNRFGNVERLMVGNEEKEAELRENVDARGSLRVQDDPLLRPSLLNKEASKIVNSRE